MKILVIGGGNMGLTYAQSFLRSHITSEEGMMILEKSPTKAAELAEKNIGTVYATPEVCIPNADLIIFVCFQRTQYKYWFAGYASNSTTLECSRVLAFHEVSGKTGI